MGRKVIYWVVTGLLPLSAVFAGVNYLWAVSRRELRRLTSLRTEMQDTLSCPVLPRGNATAPPCVRQRTPLWLPYILASQGRRFAKTPGTLHRIFALPPHRA